MFIILLQLVALLLILISVLKKMFVNHFTVMGGKSPLLNNSGSHILCGHRKALPIYEKVVYKSVKEYIINALTQKKKYVCSLLKNYV